MKTYVYKIKAMGKPRMTQRDKWLVRDVTTRYWEFKDEIKKQKVFVPDSDYHMIFHIAMPGSWSKKKKSEMDGKPHQQKPDKDNLEKAVLDAVFTDDSKVWDGRVTKYWSYEDAIEIKY